MLLGSLLLLDYLIISDVLFEMNSFVDDALSRFFDEHGQPSVTKCTWHEGMETLAMCEDESRSIQEANLGDELTGVRAHALSLGSLAVAAHHEQKPNQILSGGFVVSDLHLATWLTNIANTALSIVRLCVDGFDTQARCLLRCLQERTKQAIILFYSSADYEIWHKAFEVNESKEAFYRLFSRKSRLGRRYFEIEKALGFNQEVEILEERREQEEYASLSVHGASVSILVGSFAADHNSDQIKPAIFGRASSASGTTLRDTFWDLTYFQLLLKALLEQVHGWKPQKEQNFVFSYLSYFEAARPVVVRLLRAQMDKKSST